MLMQASSAISGLPPAIAIYEARAASIQVWLANLPRQCGVLVRKPHDIPISSLRALVRMAKHTHRLVLLGQDWRLACALHTGYHISAARLGTPHQLPPHLPVSAAVHDRRELYAAQQGRVDFVLLSPIFPTTTHPETPPLGVFAFAQLARRARLPVYALGGMSLLRWARVHAFGLPQLVGYSARSYFAGEATCIE